MLIYQISLSEEWVKENMHYSHFLPTAAKSLFDFLAEEHPAVTMFAACGLESKAKFDRIAKDVFDVEDPRRKYTGEEIIMFSVAVNLCELGVIKESAIRDIINVVCGVDHEARTLAANEMFESGSQSRVFSEIPDLAVESMVARFPIAGIWLSNERPAPMVGVINLDTGEQTWSMGARRSLTAGTAAIAFTLESIIPKVLENLAGRIMLPSISAENSAESA